MIIKDDYIENPPAFPQTIDDMGTMRSVTKGMSLRDYFAGQALVALINRDYPANNWVSHEAYLSTTAYTISDAMLIYRNGAK